jgi:hypothetical protein
MNHSSVVSPRYHYTILYKCQSKEMVTSVECVCRVVIPPMVIYKYTLKAWLDGGTLMYRLDIYHI